MHLLKWQFQSERRGNSWKASIEVQRNRIIEHLIDNPSLKAKLGDIIVKAYNIACVEASYETGLSKSLFTEQCAYSLSQILNAGFYPD